MKVINFELYSCARKLIGQAFRFLLFLCQTKYSIDVLG